jgi:hypothetical protein
MSVAGGIMRPVTTFVYRSPYEGLLSKHVRQLSDATGLDWFRRGWDEARPDPEAWVERELGVDAYGLDSIFEKAVKHNLPKPATWLELESLLREYLYVEGELAVGEGSIRVLTDDDEVSLAYFFFEDDLVRTHPDRLAYLVHADWPLPASAAESGTAARTTVVLSTIEATADWTSEHRRVEFGGVRVPDFAAYLREVPVDDFWPAELVALRALLDEDDDLAHALEQLNFWTAFGDQEFETTDLRGDQAGAHAAASDAVDRDGASVGPFGVRHPDRSRFEIAEHLLQASLQMSDVFGHRQLFVFDDLWAAQHPDLASSLIRYATHWDPLGG